ncbi:MAG: NAD-dependent epimerase/dehydratase family protein [Gemmatimonadaceae bacterium]
MALPPVCLTGASGFIGQRVVNGLAALGATHVTLLRRKTSRSVQPQTWRSVELDLLSDAIPSGTIAPGSVLIHLAGATGRADARTMQAVNVDATAKLLDAARTARVRHFIFVSSIAAGYRDQRWAPYAQSKAAAERVVIASALPYTIVRPTMVFGAGSPNQSALERLATLAFPLMPGQGQIRVQPIHVNDVADALVQIAASARAVAPPVTLGGPSTLTMRELFATIRRVRGLAPRQPVTFPLEPLRRGLALLGTATRSKLPVSAGQFVAFANDSLAEPPPPGVDLPTPLVSLEEMLMQRADA